MKVARVGIITECLGGDDSDQLRFAILSLNRLQSFCEFEIVHFFDRSTDLYKKLSSRQVLDRQKTIELANDFLSSLESAVLENSYPARAYPCDRYLIISLASFSDSYYLSGTASKLRILAVGDWRRNFFPPSLLELVVDACLKQGIREAFKNIESHVNSRGCVFDFNAQLSNTKNGIMVGCLCQDCRDELEMTNDPRISEVDSVIGGKWLGTAEDSRSTLSGLLRMGYSPFMSSGIKRTPKDWVKEKIAEPLVGEIIKILVFGVSIYLSLFFGLSDLVAKL